MPHWHVRADRMRIRRHKFPFRPASLPCFRSGFAHTRRREGEACWQAADLVVLSWDVVDRLTLTRMICSVDGAASIQPAVFTELRQSRIAGISPGLTLCFGSGAAKEKCRLSALPGCQDRGAPIAHWSALQASRCVDADECRCCRSCSPLRAMLLSPIP